MKKAKEATVQYQTDVAPQTATIQMDASLVAQLREAAAWKGVTLEEAMGEAALDYFYQYSAEKVKKEQAAFERMHPALLKKYRGQYVAIHNGEMVEHAPDLSALTKQVFARFGHTPMLRIQVTAEPLPDIKTHGLRLVREAA